MIILRYAICFTFFLILQSECFAQVHLDSASVPIDSANSQQLNDTTDTAVSDSVDVKESESPIETTINYKAKDSINFNINGKIVKLYGEAEITYGDVQLNAARVEIDYNTNLLKARSYTDSLGEEIGKPVFKDGAETYYTDEIVYNFDTEKAIISGVVTEQGDANMRGGKVFKNQYDEMFIKEAIYTTCNRPEPHFHIQTNKIKLIPDNKIVSGPGYLAVKDIPTPLIFPFGIFPMPNKKSSGVVIPSYGEENRRGFYLRNGGYYFALNDYMDLEVLGEIYSQGSWGLKMATQYKKRYAFSGNLNMRYNNQKGLSEADSSVTQDFWINWRHSPQSRGNSRFSASVNAGTSTYNQNNPTRDLTNTLKQDFNSSISYSTSFRGTPFSLSTNARWQQNVNTKVVNLLLPELALTMSRVRPLKDLGAGDQWYNDLSLSWSMNGTNRLTNQFNFRPSYNIIEEEKTEEDTVYQFNTANLGFFFNNGENGIKHRIPLSTSLKVLKYFSLNPSVNYQEIWYFKRLGYTFVPEQNAVDVDTVSGFNRVYNYSGGVSLNTNLYGTMYFKGKNIQAIRHTMRPSLSLSYTPDFSQDKFGYYEDVQVDTTGKTMRLSKYDGFIFGTPSRGENANLGISITNNLEMKVRNKHDTTENTEAFKKVPIFESFNVSTGYNFLADSFNLNRINISARTKLFNKKVNVSVSSTIDPYIYQLDSVYTDSRGERRVEQRQRDIFAWDAGRGIGQITNARISLSMNLSPKGSKSVGEQIDEVKDTELTKEEREMKESIRNNPELYVDFSIPWSLNLDYNLNYSKDGFEKPRITQGMRFSGQLSLTDKWNVGFNSGFDVQKLEFTQTNFRISRSLHCWQLSFNWTPFGRYESYNLTINARSSLLQDLKIHKQKSWYDN